MSWVWEYCRRVSGGRPPRAQCQVCSQTLATGNHGTSSLIRHLAAKHGLQAGSGGPPLAALTDPMDSPPARPAPSPAVWAWQHFQSLTPEAAMCQICQDILQESPRLQDATLSEHLLAQHQMESPPPSPARSPPDSPQAAEAAGPSTASTISSPSAQLPPSSPLTLQRPPTIIPLSECPPQPSPAWQYFDRLPNRRARCQLCRVVIQRSNAGTTSMMRHLSGLHAISLGPSDASRPDHVDATTTAAPSTSRGTVSDYFHALPNGRAQCQLCRDAVVMPKGHNPTELAAHLRLKHKIEPEHQAEIALTADALSRSMSPPKCTLTPHHESSDSEASSPPNEDPDFELDLQESDDSTATDPFPDNDLAASSSLRSQVWKYCIHLTAEVALCRFCQRIYRTTNGATTSLARHLKQMHSVNITLDTNVRRKSTKLSVAGTSDAQDPPDSAEPEAEDATLTPNDGSSPTTGEHQYAKAKVQVDTPDASLNPGEKSFSSTRPNRSWVWRHFKSAGAKTAICTHCNTPFQTTNGTTTSLRRHLTRAHALIENEASGDKPIDDNDNGGEGRDRQPVDEDQLLRERINQFVQSPRPGRSWVWRYSKTLDKNIVACLKCDRVYKTPNGSTSSIARHLRIGHGLKPTLLDEMATPAHKTKKPRVDALWNDVESDEMESGNEEADEEGSPGVDECFKDDDDKNFDVEAMDFDGEDEKDDDNTHGKQKRSWVWTHIRQSTSMSARCRICHRKFGLINGTTTQFARHLSKYHGLDPSSPMVLLPQTSLKELTRLCSQDRALPVPTKTQKFKTLERSKRLRALQSDFFEEINNQISVCKLCQTRFRNQSLISRSLHLERKHGVNLEQEVKQEHDSVVDDNDDVPHSVSKVGDASAQDHSIEVAESVEEILAKLIAVDGFPMDTLLKSAYINETLAQKNLAMPGTPQDLDAMLIKHAEHLKIKVGEELSNMTHMDLKFSLTLFEWKSEDEQIHIEVKCHGLEMSWNLGIVQEIPLMTDSMIMEAVKNVVQDFGLNFHRDIVACTTNGLNPLGAEHQKCLDQGINQAVSNVMFSGQPDGSLVLGIRDILAKLKSDCVRNKKSGHNQHFINGRALERVLSQEQPRDVVQRKWLDVLELLESVLKPEVASRMKRLLTEEELTSLKNLVKMLALIRSGLEVLESSGVNLLSADNIVVEVLEGLAEVPHELSHTLIEALSQAMEQLRNHDIVSLIKYISNPKALEQTEKHDFLKMSSREILERDIFRLETRLFRNLHKDRIPCLDRISAEMDDFESSGFLSADLKLLRQSLVTVSPTCRQRHSRGSMKTEKGSRGPSPISPQLEEALVFLKGYYDQSN